jgi:hypothetical protein
VECPDRDLLIVDNHNRAYPYYPSEGTWDEYLDMSPFNQFSVADWGLDFFMVNYLQNIEKASAASPNMRQHQPWTKGTPKIISDSGGFQILTERTEYINPIELVRWYNTNCDLGMILDIPSGLLDKETGRLLNEIQAKNTEIMMRHKSPELRLVNIFHGNSLKEKIESRKIVERDDIDILAIAGSYLDTVFTSIANMLHIALHGQKYKHYHVLGVSNFIQTILMMRAAAYDFVPLLTSDSSTAIQAAKNKQFFYRTTVYNNIGHMDIGDRQNHPSSHNVLPCSCPVCSRVRYLDVLSSIESETVRMALAMHNTIAYLEHSKAMFDVTRTTTTKELKEIIRQQLGTRKTVKEVYACLEFLDVVKESGIKEAMHRYRAYTEGYSLVSKTLMGDSETTPSDRIRRIAERYAKSTEEELNKSSAHERVKRVKGAKKRKKIGMVSGKSGPKSVKTKRRQ